MKAVICPVCNGVGKVSAGFYNRGGDCPRWQTAIANPEVCRSCDGKGWVEVSESDYNPIRELKWEYHYQPPTTIVPQDNISKCPSCGRDRNDPPLTGCPKGSHYGTYCLSGGSDAQN